MSGIARLAGVAPVSVFVALGAGAADAVERLRLDRRITFVDSPRHATVLLIAGALPDRFVQPLAQVHDQLPHPRAVLWWSGDHPIDHRGLPDAVYVGPGEDPGNAAVALHRALMFGERVSAADLLPNEPPNEWRGVGPHGQGGRGMMGGTPYGRPMAMTADDRDGLALDPLSFRLGPFLPWLPAGLHLDVTMQGDVLQHVEVPDNPFASGSVLGAPVDDSREANARGIADVETAHARRCLRYASRVLFVHGLKALAIRTLALAVDLSPADAPAVDRLARRLRRLTSLRWSAQGVGRLPAASLDRLGSSPDVRAAGRVVDTRSADPAYRRLGFTPVTQPEHGSAGAGDAWTRWLQRLDEARQSLDLAQRARDAGTAASTSMAPGDLLPDGEPPVLALLPDLLTGMEIGDAVTTVVSLQLERGIPAGVTVGATR